ncbi:DNA primase [Oceanihabitans sediminis]|uniref:DNA primase n=1 Tax=Oceanihabitans sediminis TaxID=1812012 RepID=A0A368P554_9FLAO|nr:DNA primase [Oceanihabitans sediminis]MDX1278349.1 DNA primase [Oceanihabitans sediminis]MDX1772607.1 DNA primase [Oceanihabitans sediminis]RBP34274.1 DNA primase [Oceanihabitans sediminis]RCU57962.1 DNA primase [Oceanihabitans sediminis]
MISKSTIDQVFETARVEEVIGDFVQLKKSGSSFKGLSPFSDERSPSFMVSPVKQIWKDFSSGKGGNVVAFLMEHEHFTYPEAIKYLAKKYNIEIEETEQTNEQKEQANERESLYLVSEYASSYFQKILHNTDKGKSIGLSYFKERGFTDETIKKFALGYSLDEWQAFTDEALKQAYKLEFLEKTGLTIVKGEKRFDRFKGRVMFPIQSMSGRVLGFGGRILTNDKKAAKYLNSPESDIYHKSKVLYGIYQAKQSIAKEDNCYLVEGYTDVIQFHQTGVHNVVSSSGTALTPEQIRLINRLTKNITVLFDGDAAGLRASLRGIDLILEQGMNVKICTFPAGEDPDSFAKQNTFEELTAYLTENAQDFIQFKASVLYEESKNDPIKKAETIRDIVNSIAKIPDRIKKEIYIQECSRIMDISEQVLFTTLAQIDKKDFQDAKKQQPQEKKAAFQVIKQEQQAKKVDVQYLLERKIIEILLLYGNRVEDFEDLVLKENEQNELVLEPVKHQTKVFEKIYLDLQDDEIQFTNPQFKNLYYTIIDNLNQNPDFAIEHFVNTVEPEVASEITSILMDDERYSLSNWHRKDIFPKEKEHTVAQLASETILSLRCFLIDQKVTEFMQETLNNKSEVNKDILEEVKDYSSLKMLLSRKLNRVL